MFRADSGLRAKSEKFRPSHAWLFQDPKFSSESNCLFGLSTGALGTVLPKASAVVLAKVA